MWARPGLGAWMSGMAPRHGHLLNPAPSWVAARQVGSRACSGRGLAQPSSPRTRSPAPKPPRSIWAATWAVHRPNAMPRPGLGGCVHLAVQGSYRNPLLQHRRDHLGAAGPPPERDGQPPECRGPRHTGSQTTPEWTGHWPRYYCPIRTLPRDAQGHGHSGVDTRARPTPRLSLAGLRAVIGSRSSSC